MSFPAEQLTEREQRRIFFRRLFRRVFLEDWLLKVVASVITLALWLGVTGLRTPITTRLSPPVALNLRVSSDMEITSSSATEVEVFVTGDNRRIGKINPRDLVVSVDLTDVKPGDLTLQLTPANVNLELPSGVKLDEIQPNKIAVRLERVEERDVAVKPETEGSVADGFEIYSQQVLPANVRVRGAESVVRQLDAVTTEKINLDNRNEDFTAHQVGVNIVNPNVTVLDGIVDVAFKIGEKRIERSFNVPVKTDAGVKKVAVILFGARSVLENLRPEDLQIELAKSGTGETVPQLVVPPDVQDKIEVRKLKINS